MRRAIGEARSARPVPLAAAGGWRLAAGGAVERTGWAGGAAAATGVGGGAGFGAVAAASSRPETSSSALPMTAMSAPTFTLSPGAATIFRMMPLV